MSDIDELIKRFAATAEAIYEHRTAGDHTWTGVFATFAHELQALSDSDKEQGVRTVRRLMGSHTDSLVRYDTRVVINKNGDLTDSSCDCPAKRFNPLSTCKHARELFWETVRV